MFGAVPEAPPHGFSHEALLYAGEGEFLKASAAFVRDGIALDEPVLVAVNAHRSAALRAELGADHTRVSFVDMTVVGHNPARILPMWRNFVDSRAASTTRCRGVGEPIWSSRPEIELIECQRHESLLNVAFGGGEDLWLLCPYDVEALDRAVLDEVRRSHPFVVEHGRREPTGEFNSQQMAHAHLQVPLAEPPSVQGQMAFGPDRVRDLREYVAGHLVAVDMDPERAFDFLVAVSEVATNTLRHGGGQGTVRVWHDEESLVCEVADRGILSDPLAGRLQPVAESENSRGLWLVNQLCDLVQIRVFDTGTVVRLHMAVR